MWRDARLYQILFLGLLLGAGAWLRDFSLRPAQVVLTFAAGWLTQAACERLWGVRRSGTLSALITSFSLSILLRAGNLWAHPLAAAAAIGGKFIFRARGKHLFNPGNLGIVLSLIFLPGTWTSPGQWGHDLAFAAWFVALGVVVTSKARRGDVSWAFLAFYLGAIALRVAWLGQSRAVWLHQLSNGSLLLFAFFMISDPMTIPNHPRGRTAHAALVAAVAFLWQYALYRPNGPLWALFLCAPAVPLWDLIWPAAKFEWRPVTLKGDRHEPRSTPSVHPAPVAPAGVGGPLGPPLPHPAA
ncbi:MAG: Na+-transporting NADH:ubiquinone oxidoreductase, subunit NqrB [Acidobacteria bacterium]|nr:MAG: Na+-transporting NADH:ubiquinone oxidoreductase, subunit NqrB [Acidobacteriota bacterium]